MIPQTPRSTLFPTRRSSDLSEFKVKVDDYAQVDPASERILLQIDEPQMNHNCGRMVFGPDGRPCAHSCDSSAVRRDRKSTRLNSSHVKISYAVLCLKKKR